MPKMEPVNLVLFGDQTVEKLSSIQSLVRHSKTSPAARRFLQEATDTVQLEFSRLSKEDRGWNHEIHTLLGLAEENVAEEQTNGIVATILMCIGRLGELIVYAEEDPTILGSEKSPTEILAYCTGLLPAAALVAARDTSELFAIGKEIISITFRMAFEITRRMRLIEDGPGNWATTIVGVTVERMQAILDDFHKSQNIPTSRKVTIGVISTGWLTLVAAPSSLARLTEWSQELDQAAKVKTDTNGPIHTTYMPRLELDKVLGNSPVLNASITSKAKVLSPSSCKPYMSTTLRDLLGEMLTDIAHNVLYLNDTTEACISGLVGRGDARLTVAGPTGHLALVQRTLKSKDIKYQVRQHKAPHTEKPSRGGSDLVAIVGMAGRFPGSETIEGFWEDLLAAKGQITRVPKSRFDLDDYYDPTGQKKNSTTAQHGAFLDKPGFFDNRLFNVSPREAAQMDPIQRLLLTISYEALEMAGYSKDATLATQSNRIATYFGQASEDWREVLNNEGTDIYYVPSLSRPFAPSRLNYHYKWGGASYALDTACSTSTTAISLACSALIGRSCDTALAGGGSILASPNTFSGLSKSGMISDNGGCRTFHDDADGYARGEGIGVVVLKRLEDAVADNDNILALLRGSARTYSSTSTSITHPSAQSQVRIYEEVLRQTSVNPNDISYVEMHGTGTQAGDLEEMTSVIKVMGQGRSRDNPLTVGAVKANVGHGEGAAGVTSLIKVIMMLRDRKICSQPGMPFKLNHSFPKLDKINVQIAGKDVSLKPNPSGDGKIKIIVNSFDASGGNTSLVVEEPPSKPAKTENPLPCHVVTISARTVASLQGNRRRLLDYLTRNLETKVADLAYTTTARRMHEVLRVAYSAGSTREIAALLRADVAKETSSDPKTKPPKATRIFAFTGQGSQYAGMGKDFYRHSSALREVLHTYQEMAQSQGLPYFLDLISDGTLDVTTVSTVRVQLAVVALQIALAHMMKTWGVQPDAVVGHSLGEYSALCAAGVLSVSDTLFLVGQRAILMEKTLTAGEYSMLAVGTSAEMLREKLSAASRVTPRKLDIACINSPKTTVVSGTIVEIASFKSELEQQGVRATQLKVPYGFHSPHVDSILGEFEHMARGVVFSAPKIPVASTLRGSIAKVGDGSFFSPSYLARQARECVNFVGALGACRAAGFANDRTQWIEIGPEPVCLGLIRGTLDVPQARLLPVLKSAEDNWVTLSSSLAALYKSGASINWPEYHKNFTSSLTLLNLPTYAFDEKDFWTTYKAPRLATSSVDSRPKFLETPTAPLVPGFPTTGLQRVENEDISGKLISVTFASQTCDPSLYKAIQGHVVHGLTICPLSIFCDMALSAAQYAYLRLQPGKQTPSMSLKNVEMTHALVVPEVNLEQVVKTTVTYSATGDRAHITFQSETSGVTTENGNCQVIFREDGSPTSSLRQTLFLINARIQSLKDLALAGKAHRLLKPIVYKLFENLVIYGKDYHGLDEVWLDAESRDAVGTVTLTNPAGDGQFLFNPYWIDTAVHLAGFLLNGGLKYSDDIACLSTGFESWQPFEELKADKPYTTYVSMQETEKDSVLSGEAYVFSGSKLVQVTTGIKFQRMKKLALTSILQPATSAAPTLKPVCRNSLSGRTRKQPKVLSGFQTPVSQYDFDSDNNQTSYSATPTGPHDDPSTPASSISGDDEPNIVDVLLAAVAAETGSSIEEMDPGTAFSDMGVDSLMSITIFSSIKRDTGVELPGTFFFENSTVGEARAALGATSEDRSDEAHLSLTPPSPIRVQQQAEQASAQIVQTPVLERGEQQKTSSLAPPVAAVTATPRPSSAARSSKAILLQGSQSSCKQKLFLLPDGSGSPTNYIQLPSLGSEVCVYGLESPFVKTPSEYTCSLGEMADTFIEAIRKQQPTGPYFLGGFSFGAIYAYEVARKVIEANEAVDGLLLIDMAVPKSSQSWLSPTIEQLDVSGLLPLTGRQSITQKEHLISTIHAVANYTLKPCPSEARPNKTILITSKSGLGFGKAQSSELAQWAQGQSNSSPMKGWEDLVGEVELCKVEADHFALLRYPALKSVGELCKEAVAKFRE